MFWMAGLSQVSADLLDLCSEVAPGANVCGSFFVLDDQVFRTEEFAVEWRSATHIPVGLVTSVAEDLRDQALEQGLTAVSGTGDGECLAWSDSGIVESLNGDFEP